MTETYLLDTSAVVELLRNRPKVIEWLRSIPSDSILAISGWTVIELLKEKKGKYGMNEVVAKLQQYQTVWPNPEICNEIFGLLINKYHSERSKTDGKLSGNAIFDSMIYLTTKSYNFTLVTMDSGFDSFEDIKVKKLKSS